METKTYSIEIFRITYTLLIKDDSVDEKKDKRYNFDLCLDLK